MRVEEVSAPWERLGDRKVDEEKNRKYGSR
jgi:hypothetical protein